MKIAIDALNLYSGGSITHLNNFIVNFHNQNKNDYLVIILFKNLPVKIINSSRIKYVYINFKKNSVLNRLMWQLFKSKSLYKKLQIDWLFVPGGVYIGNFKPFIVMCRNMLLFENNQINLYDSVITRLSIHFKAYIQLFTFYRSSKLIFISNYAKNYLELKYNWIRQKKTFVIHHGISKLFYNVWNNPKNSDTYRLVYSSAFEPYKNHHKLIEAINILIKKQNYKFELILIGNKSNSKYFHIISNMLNAIDKNKFEYEIHENLSHKKIANILSNSKLFIFPSSCENMPNALLEAQISGIPILSSNLGPMQEFLTDNDIQFNPLDVNEIVDSINNTIINYDKIMRQNTSKIYKKYNWEKTYNKTIQLFN